MSQDTQIQTFTGHFFDFLDLEHNVIDIKDVAHSLSNQCRWTGHTKFFLSIAQHSCYCYDRATQDNKSDAIRMEALLHDGSEYVMIDLSRPLKSILPDYRALQLKIEALFATRFRIPELMSPEVKEIDDRMLVTEYYQLLIPGEKGIHPNIKNFYLPPYTDLIIEPWSPIRAETEFMNRYMEISALHFSV